MKDEILEEIHETRGRLLAECQGNLEELLNRYRAAEAQDAERLVTLAEVRKRRERSLRERGSARNT